MQKQKSSSDSKLSYFVGREQELKILDDAFRLTVKQNDCRLVLIQGDYGVGKTALVQYFIHCLKNKERSLLIGQGKCSMETDANGLVPFSQIFTELAKKRGVRGASDNLLNFTKKVAPAWLDIITAGFASAITTTIEEGVNLAKPSQAKFTQDSVFVQFVNAIKHLVGKHPAIFFVDDIHWADKSSLQLLFHLVRNLHEQAILIIATFRPVEALETGSNAKWFRDELRPNLLREKGVVELVLEKGIQIPEYIQQRYPHNQFPLDLADRIYQKTDGHALFVEQLFSLWEETRTIICQTLQNNSLLWKFSPEFKDIPEILPAVSEILDARVRLLSELLQQILVRASVEGEDFTVQTVANLMQLDELKTYDEIEKLENNYKLVQDINESTDALIFLDFYRFMHRFIREHIYKQLGSGQRRILHSQVGLCLEQLYRADRKPIAGQLARHFSEAKDYRKSVTYSLIAAQHEVTRYSWSEVDKWCQFGLELVRQLPADQETHNKCLAFLQLSALSFYNVGNYKRASNYYREALQQSLQSQTDNEIMADICYHIADTMDELGKFEEGLDYIKKGKLVLGDNYKSGMARLTLEMMEGLLLARLGNNVQAIELLQSVLVQIKGFPQNPTSDLVLERTTNHLAVSFGYLNDYGKSIPMYKMAINVTRRTGNQIQEAICLANMADDYILAGEPNKAEKVSTQSFQLSHQIGDRGNEAWALSVRGNARIELGLIEDAISDLTQATALLDNSESWVLVYAHANLAVAYLASKDIQSASFHAHQSVDFAGSDRYYSAMSLNVLGKIDTELGNWDEAVISFKRAFDLCMEIGALHFAAIIRRDWAIALLKKGELKNAQELLTPALSFFENIGLQYEIDVTVKLLEQIKP